MLDDAAFEALAGIEVWIVDCIRYEPHVTHSHLDKTLEWIARVKPRRAVLTHMDDDLDYETLAPRSCRQASSLAMTGWSSRSEALKEVGWS